MYSKNSMRGRAVLLMTSICLTLLMLEVAVRVRQYYKYGTANDTVFKTVIDRASGLGIPAPGWTTRTIRINSKGFRSADLDEPKPHGRVRLAFLGSSTTYCAEVSSNDATWPHLVFQHLQKIHPNVTFDYVNAGIPGYTLALDLKNLEYRVKPLRPDVIIIYEGVNDFSKDTREVAKKQGLYSGESMAVNDFMSRYSVAWYTIEMKAKMILRARKAAQPTGRLRLDADSLSHPFHERYRALVEAAQQAAPVVAVATFSQKVRREQTFQEQLRASQSTLFYNPFLSVDDILRGMDGYNRAIRAVASETGATLIDGENEIPGDDAHFNDSVHFNDAGAVIMARRVVNGLEQSKAFSALVGLPKASDINMRAGAVSPPQ